MGSSLYGPLYGVTWGDNEIPALYCSIYEAVWAAIWNTKMDNNYRKYI